MSFCEMCGSRVPSGATQCPVCDEPLTAATTTDNQPAAEADAPTDDIDDIDDEEMPAGAKGAADSRLADYEKRLDTILENIQENLESWTAPSVDDLLPPSRAGDWDEDVIELATTKFTQGVVLDSACWDSSEARGKVCNYSTELINKYIDEVIQPIYDREKQLLDVFREDAMFIARRVEEKEDMLERKKQIDARLKETRPELRAHQQLERSLRDEHREAERAADDAKRALEDAREKVAELAGESEPSAGVAALPPFTGSSTATHPIQYLSEVMMEEVNYRTEKYNEAAAAGDPAEIKAAIALMNGCGPKYQALIALAAAGQWSIPADNVIKSAPVAAAAAESPAEKNPELEAAEAAVERLEAANGPIMEAFKAVNDKMEAAKKHQKTLADEENSLKEEKKRIDAILRKPPFAHDTDAVNELDHASSGVQIKMKNDLHLHHDIRNLYRKHNDPILIELADAADNAAWDARREKEKQEWEAEFQQRKQVWRSVVEAAEQGGALPLDLTGVPQKHLEAARQHGASICRACARLSGVSGDLEGSSVEFLTVSFMPPDELRQRLARIPGVDAEQLFYQRVLPALAQEFEKYYNGNTGRFQDRLDTCLSDDRLQLGVDLWEERPELFLDAGTMYLRAPASALQSGSLLECPLSAKDAVQVVSERLCPRCTNRVVALSYWVKGHCRSCWRILNPPARSSSSSSSSRKKKKKVIHHRRCFSSDTLVTRVDERGQEARVPMSEVRVGDLLLTLTEGRPRVSPCVYVRHSAQLPATDRGTALHVDGEVLRLTHDHLVFSVTLQRFVMARHVLLGDHLMVAEGGSGAVMRSAPVTRVSDLCIDRLTTLYTQSGTVLANTLLASCYESNHSLRHATAADTRALFRLAPGSISRPLVAKLWDARDLLEDVLVDSYYGN